MMIVLKYAYQLWKTIDKDVVTDEVVKGTITTEDYKTITGEEYVKITDK